MTQDTLAQVPKAETMMATAGYQEFKRNYTQFLALAETDQENFLMHDVSNMTSTLFAAMLTEDVIGSSDLVKKYETALADFTSPEKNANARLEIISGIIDGISGLNRDKVMEYFADQGEQRWKQLNALKSIFPVLKSSVSFLDRPNSSNLGKLLSQKTDLQTIFDLTMIEKKADINYSVDAPNAVILINLLNNAKKFGGEGIEVDMKKDSVTISNPSRNPLPERLFELGGKGGQGNRGYGLFLAQKLYAPLVDHNVTASSNLLPTGRYDVKFTLASNRSK